MNKKAIKSFFLKYNKILIFALLLIGSIGFSIYFAHAQNDADANKFAVNNIKISNVIDGTEPWDSDDSAGNDSTGTNGKVRNFDSINYQISFDLVAKSGQTVNMSNRRDIIVDLIIPTSIDGNVVAGSTNTGVALQKVFGTYSYAEFTLSLTPGTNRIDFSLSDINASNNTVISPIIAIKESTDTSSKSIGELTDDQRNENYESISSSFNKSNTCTNTISGDTSCDVTVTGINNYFINLYQGSTTKEENVTNIPIGIMIGLKNRKVGNIDKGIKGLLVPDTVSFDINSISSASNPVTYVDNSARSYKSRTQNENNGLDYTIYIDDNNSIELPEVNINNSGNGDIAVTESTDGNIKLTVSNIKNKVLPLNGTDLNYISTNSLEIISTRTDETMSSGVRDINISISAVSGETTYSTINALDSYSRFVGTYESKINLYDSKDDVMDSKNPKTDGQAVYNYNEEFYIKTSLQYAVTSGDGLDNLRNFIKIDNDAISLMLNNDGLEYDIKTDIIDNTKVAPYIDKETGEGVTLYYGKWNTEYFERTSNADSYGCPSDISRKETLMNLFGGPCIQTTNKVKRTHYLNGEVIGGGELTDEEMRMGPLIVESLFTPAESEDYVNPTSTATITLKAQIKNEQELINTAHQITTSATGLFTDDSGHSELYYLSNQNDHSGIDIMTNSNNYTMTNYDFNSKNVITDNNTVCNNLTCAVTGNTILVSAVRVSKPTVTTFYNDVETTDFYYYPIEFRIDANAYRNDMASSSFDGATIDVYIPKYLRYTRAEFIKEETGDVSSSTIIDVSPTSITPVSYRDIEYNKLTFNFDASQIVMGAIPRLKVYTNIYLNTPNNSNPAVFVTADYNVLTTKINPDGTVVTRNYSSIEPVVDRTSFIDNITIHNNADITTQGILSSRYIEKNSSYDYQMQAFNNSTDYSYNNTGIYYVLPYKGDSSFSDLESKFEATGFKIKLKNALPNGYKAYYTTGNSANIINYEIEDVQNKGYSWVEWTNPTSPITDATAIKIEKTSAFTAGEYFGGENGIIVNVEPVNSSIGDSFYNNFYVISDKPNGLSCNGSDPTCNSSTGTNKVYYSSSRDLVSVYNRIISGFVWEDYDYSGLFDNDESRIENIPVSLYKISDSIENIDSNDPSSFVGKEGEEWIADTTTDSNGRYTFRGLNAGLYYVKFTYDDKKYSVTEKGAGITSSVPGANSINSKCLALAGSNNAVSSVVKFTGEENSSVDNMNLGIAIRKQFAVTLKKYITNMVVNENGNTKSYDYDNASQVTLNVKNPRNTSVRITYNFMVENNKYFPGYIGLIEDKMPTGMTFNPNIKENQDWSIYGNTIYYTGLSGKLLLPNEKYYFSLVLDLNVTEGGNYVNVVSAKDLTLMGDELPEYDFNTLDVNENTSNESEGD